MNSVEWTTLGTARSHFNEICKDDALKEQIFTYPLKMVIKKIKRQFAKANIGSELFYQVFDFLIWLDFETDKDKKFSQRFLVLLSGLLFMREANTLGSNCIPWEILKNKITNILLKSGISKNDLNPEIWKKWLLTSFGENLSENLSIKKTIFFEKNSFIYFYKNWLIELDLVTLISDRLKIKLSPPPKKLIKNSIKFVLEINPIRFGEESIKLSFEQKKALLLSIYSPILVITGGPGTGKTSLAVILLRVLKMLGLAKNPALVSPTGRAAKRMNESLFSSLNSIKDINKLAEDQELLGVAAAAKTLHRLLGYNHFTDGFKFHEFAPLDNDLLIVDEVSMIDQKLMTNLLKASNSLLPHQAPVQRIILLGDPDQLPSVGSGSVLLGLKLFANKIKRKNLNGNQFRIVKLLRNFRQNIKDPSGRNILGVAEKIKEFSERESLNLFFQNSSSSNKETIRMVKNIEDVVLEKVSFLNQANSMDQLKLFATWWVEKFLSNEKFCSATQMEFNGEDSRSCLSKYEYFLNYLDRFRVLTMTQVFSTGAKAINQIIREKWLTKIDTKNIFSDHYPGEPVMITKNDYRLNLFNGDMGIFLKFKNHENGESVLKAVFQVDGVFKTFHQNELSGLLTAYAITVHKSQGSEYNNLALILPELYIKDGILDQNKQNFHEILTNQMLYTALTRAKESVLILGNLSILKYLLLNKTSRFSGIGNYVL
tara:strand:+ start:1396 stop:3531 length:2136 start_codon:yes stop_codon:yes gene_type:complete